MTDTNDIYIHPSSYVGEGVAIGVGTRIWHFCNIIKGAEIGENCSIGQNCVIFSTVKIGNNVKVQNNVSIYDGVVVEDDVFLGPSMVFTNVYNPRSAVNRKSEYRKTLVKMGATIGANATIICGITLGAYSFIGAGALVNKDIPDYGLVVGNPGKLIGYMSRRGHRLNFDSEGWAACPESGDRYKLSNGTVSIKEQN